MHEINGLAFPFQDYFDRFGENILGFGKTAREETLKHVTNFRNAVDIGAHVGISVHHWAPLFEHVYAFEPMVDHYDCLVKNTAKFNNVECFNNAMSNESCMLKGAYRSMKNSGSFQLVDEEFLANNNKNAKIYNIPSKRLDEFNLENVDMIKIDVEGWEFEVLKGAEQTIRCCKPILMVEYTHGGGKENKSMHTYDIEEYRSFIKSLDYVEICEAGGDTIYGPK